MFSVQELTVDIGNKVEEFPFMKEMIIFYLYQILFLTKVLNAIYFLNSSKDSFFFFPVEQYYFTLGQGGEQNL